VGTFGGALEARGIQASGGTLTADGEGDVEVEDGVLVLRRIRVHYRVAAPVDASDVVERVHRVHRDSCPVYRSIHRAIDVTTTFELV
jgi:uncharacterized OsmC-like protein